MKSTIIGLCNPKSPSNVGSVIRAAGCYQASSIRYTGERFDRAAKYKKDTNLSDSKIPLRHVDELLHDLPEDMKVVCVELVPGAKALPEFDHPDCSIYVFGAEDNSIPQDIINRADDVVYVPTIGSMNLAATVNVVLYDKLVKANDVIDHEALILDSRDQNNRLLLKSS